MPRLVRRASLSARLSALLDPGDFLLWLAETLNDDAYDDWLNDWATLIGLALNVVFILARGASQIGGSAARHGAEDVFGDDALVHGRRSSGWMAWLAACLVYGLTLLSCGNAVYTFARKRHYRLFEQPVDTAPAPATPSARRVRVDSSPLVASPLRYLQHVLNRTTAESRAHPDAEHEVWEISRWDPKAANLTLFTLFSPGHVLLYLVLLPPTYRDPTPSFTLLTAFAFSALFSIQLMFLKSSFSRQATDSALVQAQVMHEYDTKFVRPSLNRPVRDVATQTGARREVDVYTPTTLINRGFRTNPNPNYVDEYDPQHLSPGDTHARLQSSTPGFKTPAHSYINGNALSTTPLTTGRSASSADLFSSPLKAHHERLRAHSPTKGDGGNMGVYAHAASPLRKTASSAQLRPGQLERVRGGLAGTPGQERSTPGRSVAGGDRDGVDAAERWRRRQTGRY